LGREALIDTLAAYKKIKSHKITVVFDGTNAPDFSQQLDRVKGIEIRFSRSGESADAVIKKMASKEREKALVVSSDRDIIHCAASSGAATISASLFEEKLAMAAYVNHEDFNREDKSGWTPTTRKKGPKRKRSKKERQNRIKVKKL